MAVDSFAQSERSSLSELLLDVGPQAPTLCAGWTTRDLAAHLILRESRPDAALGILGGPLAAHTARVQESIATRDWVDLVNTLRNGPPRWSPQSIGRLDAESNTVEYFVHHEDVRRAINDWQPRELTPTDVAALWPRITRLGKLLLRRCSVGVVVEPTDGPAAGTRVTLKQGDGVTLHGPVGEITLALFGRVTRGLEVVGSDADRNTFLTFPR